MQPGKAVLGGIHLVATFLEILAEVGREVVIVFDDKDSHKVNLTRMGRQGECREYRPTHRSPLLSGSVIPCPCADSACIHISPVRSVPPLRMTSL